VQTLLYHGPGATAWEEVADPRLAGVMAPDDDRYKWVALSNTTLGSLMTMIDISMTGATNSARAVVIGLGGLGWSPPMCFALPRRSPFSGSSGQTGGTVDT